MNDDQNVMITKRQYLVVSVVFLITLIIAFALVPYLVTTKTGLWSYDASTGAMGDTIGGIAGPIIGVIGMGSTFLAFFIQYTANKIQFKSMRDADRQAKVQQVENNFFRMIDYHNLNVNQFRVPNIDSNKKTFSEGKRAFVQFKIQIKRLLELVCDINSENNLDLSREEIVDVAYIVFYYGLEGSWVEFIQDKLKRYPNGILIVEKISQRVFSDPSLKLGRTNQTYLSAYFRNMYNAIRLVDENDDLTEGEKIRVVKTYRAQLSNPELYVTFFNVISRFGKKWIEGGYVNKYEFLKNIPKGYCDGYEPSQYFDIVYEDDEYD